MRQRGCKLPLEERGDAICTSNVYERRLMHRPWPRGTSGSQPSRLPVRWLPPSCASPRLVGEEEWRRSTPLAATHRAPAEKEAGATFRNPPRAPPVRRCLSQPTARPPRKEAGAGDGSRLTGAGGCISLLPFLPTRSGKGPRRQARGRMGGEATELAADLNRRLREGRRRRREGRWRREEREGARGMRLQVACASVGDYIFCLAVAVIVRKANSQMPLLFCLLLLDSVSGRPNDSPDSSTAA
jgi:hypothetical protein